ncbi:MAG: Asp-tRNA(Asn)/Glu-tRNA(Gln) amidotransferase subunit GatB [Gammaproteobacteria bacterium]|nr:Asp-tRNA(Asn)/Glu-tRNA(Gln) amidotransferase subunit GatB [Gammaproteobacteria bacterium]
MSSAPVNCDDYQTVIGLEVHVQLKTRSKLFSDAPNSFGRRANSKVSIIDLGMPGMLPVVNREVIICAIRLGLALGARIHPASVFARKHYFYPDLPKGYQISQFEDPIVANGHIDIDGDDGRRRSIDVERAHLEEDAGKLVHLADRTSGADFNRSGVPLLEVVTAPQMHSPAEAGRLMRALHHLVRYLDICTGNLEEGAFRCDANVSLRPDANAPLGVRTELKNINSFRFVEKAIVYEVERQRRCLESGQAVVQETRLYDSERDETRSMRSKEDAQDYRYFPDPDLLPLCIDEQLIAEVKSQMPVLPRERARLWSERHGLGAEDAQRLCADIEIADYFEAVAAAAPSSAREAAQWLANEVLPRMEQGGEVRMSQCPVPPQQLAAILERLAAGALTTPMARKLFDLLWRQPGSNIDELVEQHNLKPVSDESELEKFIDTLFEQNPSQASQLLAGKDKLKGFFVGLVMKHTQGRADPRIIDELIRRRLQRTDAPNANTPDTPDTPVTKD